MLSTDLTHALLNHLANRSPHREKICVLGQALNCEIEALFGHIRLLEGAGVVRATAGDGGRAIEVGITDDGLYLMARRGATRTCYRPAA